MCGSTEDTTGRFFAASVNIEMEKAVRLSFFWGGDTFTGLGP